MMEEMNDRRNEWWNKWMMEKLMMEEMNGGGNEW